MICRRGSAFSQTCARSAAATFGRSQCYPCRSPGLSSWRCCAYANDTRLQRRRSLATAARRCNTNRICRPSGLLPLGKVRLKPPSRSSRPFRMQISGTNISALPVDISALVSLQELYARTHAHAHAPHTHRTCTAHAHTSTRTRRTSFERVRKHTVLHAFSRRTLSHALARSYAGRLRTHPCVSCPSQSASAPTWQCCT